MANHHVFHKSHEQLDSSSLKLFWHLALGTAVEVERLAMWQLMLLPPEIVCVKIYQNMYKQLIQKAPTGIGINRPRRTELMNIQASLNQLS